MKFPSLPIEAVIGEMEGNIRTSPHLPRPRIVQKAHPHSDTGKDPPTARYGNKSQTEKLNFHPQLFLMRRWSSFDRIIVT